MFEFQSSDQDYIQSHGPEKGLKVTYFFFLQYSPSPCLSIISRWEIAVLQGGQPLPFWAADSRKFVPFINDIWNKESMSSVFQDVRECCVCSVVSDSLQPHGLAACQVPLPMGFSRQEYWSGPPFPSLGDLPDPGIKPPSFASPALAGGFFTPATPGKPLIVTLRYFEDWAPVGYTDGGREEVCLVRRGRGRGSCEVNGLWRWQASPSGCFASLLVM